MNTIYINLLVFVLLLILFEKLRHVKSVYFCREEWMRHRRPPDLPPGFLTWVRPLMSIPKERILQLAGLDAYMLLRYIQMCLKICLCSGFFGLVVLLPMYVHGDRSNPSDGRLSTIMKDPKLISLGNIKDLHWLWVPIAIAYFTTFHTLYLLKSEYKRFLTLRLTFLSVGDPDVNIQKSFSVMVDRIPLEYRNNVGLYTLFDEIFPGDVHSAVVALRADALEDLVQKRAALVDSLEKALATRSVSNREPMIFVPHPHGIQLWNRLCRRGSRVEAVAHYQRALDELNAKITNVQIMIRQASEDMDRKEEKRYESRRQLVQQNSGSQAGAEGAVAAGLLHGVSSRKASIAPLVLGNADSRSQLMSRESADQVLAVEGATHLDPDGTTIVIDNEAGDTSRIGGVLPRHTIQRRRPSFSKTLSRGRRAISGSASTPALTALSDTRPCSAPPQAPPAAGESDPAVGEAADRNQNPADRRGRVGGVMRAPPLASNVLVEGENEDEGGEEDRAQVGGGEERVPAQQSLCCWLRRGFMRALRAGKRTGMGAVEAGQEVTKVLSMLAVNPSMSSTGFVTFKSMTSAAVASQSLLTMEPFMFTINPAPEPRDVVWQNLTAPIRLVEWRETSTTVVITILSLFWGALVSSLYKMQSQLQAWGNSDPALDRLGSLGRFALFLGIDFVPTLLLLIILAILPNLFWWLSRNYERIRTNSDIDASVMARYFYYQMVNIYATIVGGALLDEVMAIIQDPRVVVRVLGCQVPVVAVYFMQIIVTKAFSALMWEFTRAWPLIRVAFLHFFTDHDRKTARQRRARVYVPIMAYGWTYPSLLLVLTICLTYVVIMPIALVIGAVYFFLIEILYTYHVLYVYVPQYEGGGRMWYSVFDRTLVALLLSHLTLIGYMAVLGAGYLIPFLLPLPLILIGFYRHCQHGYEEASLKLSLLAARRIDDCLREEDYSSSSPPPRVSPSRPSTSSRLIAAGMSSARSSPGREAEASASFSQGANESHVTGDTGSGQNQHVQGPTSPTAALPKAPGGKRRFPTAVNAEGEDTEPEPPREAPLIVDHFQISAYAQPSLTEGPQEAEVLPWHRQHPDAQGAAGTGSGDLEQPRIGDMDTWGPRPVSLTHSDSAFAKRMKISEALEDLRVPLSPFPTNSVLNRSTAGSEGHSPTRSGDVGVGGINTQREQQRSHERPHDDSGGASLSRR